MSVSWTEEPVTLAERATTANLAQWQALTGSLYRVGPEEPKLVRCDFCEGEAALEEVTICPYFDLIMCPACREAPTLAEEEG